MWKRVGLISAGWRTQVRVLPPLLQKWWLNRSPFSLSSKIYFYSPKPLCLKIVEEKFIWYLGTSPHDLMYQSGTWKFKLNPQLPAPSVGIKRKKSCRQTHVSISMNVRSAKHCWNHWRGTAAFTAVTELWNARRSRRRPGVASLRIGQWIPFLRVWSFLSHSE